jgi:hypothetical protein
MIESNLVKNFRIQFIETVEENSPNSINKLLLGGRVNQAYRLNIYRTVMDSNPDLEAGEVMALQRNTFESEVEQNGRPNYYESKGEKENFFKTLNEKKLKNYDLIYLLDNIRGARKVRDSRSPLVNELKANKLSSKPQSNLSESDEESIGKSVYLYQNEKYCFPYDHTEELIDASKFLSKTGYIILSSKGDYFNDEVFEGIFNDLGLFINAIYQAPLSSSTRRDTILIISKNNSSSIFVANLEQKDNLPVNFLSEPNLDEGGLVSYYDKKSSEEKIKKLFSSITKHEGDRVSVNRLFDDPSPDYKDSKGHRFISVDLENLSIKESCKTLSTEISASMSFMSDFLHISILSKKESRGKKAKLKKSQLLTLLRENPRVLAYDSLDNKIGSKNSVFIYLNQKYKEPIIKNFFLEGNNLNQENNLDNGYYLARDNFHSIDQLRSQSEVEKNKFFFYGDYKEVYLSDLVDKNVSRGEEIIKMMMKITRTGSLEKGAILGIKSRIFLKSTLDDVLSIYFDKNERNSLSGEHEYFYFKDKSKAKYLEIFLNSNIGRQIYLSNMKFISNGRNRFSFDEILSLKVLIPKKDVLLGTISAHEKITQLERSVSDLHKSFSQNPKGTISKRLDMLDDMLEVAGKLNKSDIVFATIRGDEKGDAEFKASWRLPIKNDGTPGSTKDEKFEPTSIATEATVLKVISSFINTRGGRLIIGVNDDRDIIGLKDELRIFYGKKFKSLKKQKDAFDLDFGQSLRTYFELEFIGKDKNITSEFVDIEGSKDFVYLVTCTPSDKACLVKKVTKGSRGKKITEELKNKEYFVRKKSESISLEGMEMVNHITDRYQN